jgi:hypothetical protein
MEAEGARLLLDGISRPCIYPNYPHTWELHSRNSPYVNHSVNCSSEIHPIGGEGLVAVVKESRGAGITDDIRSNTVITCLTCVRV